MAERWLAAIEKGLLAHLIRKFEEDSPATANSLVDVDTSLLSSGWQKSIRRGDVDVAMGCVASLHVVDPDYVWRRLRGIALEEVSAADPELVGQVLAIAGKRLHRRKVGDLQLALHFTTRLARSPKCRTACDFLMWQEPPATLGWDAVFARLRSSRPWSLSEIALQAQAWQSITARSTYRQGRWVVLSRADTTRRDALLEAVGAPDLIRYLVVRGNGTDTLNALLVPAYQLAQQFDVPGVGRDVHEWANTRIGALPAYAYCLFSAPGRAALRILLRTDLSLARFFRTVPAADALRAVGHVVFQREGEVCREVYEVALANEIRAASEAATLARYGVPTALQPDLHALVQAAWPRLHDARNVAAKAMQGRRIRDQPAFPSYFPWNERP